MALSESTRCNSDAKRGRCGFSSTGDLPIAGWFGILLDGLVGIVIAPLVSWAVARVIPEPKPASSPPGG